jgi:photosynthetic reaction center H subunit
MSTGALTSYFDVAQITLYGFWLFFAGLILYLRTEDKREGYPLESDLPDRIRAQGFPSVPKPKEYLLQRGGIRVVPSDAGDSLPEGTEKGLPGQPLETGSDPLTEGIGPGSYTLRRDTPDLTVDGHPKILPLRIATAYSVEPRDPDPRGMDVVGADGHVGGVVRDLWVDQADYLFRYLEVEVSGSAGKHVLLPINFTRIDGRHRKVRVASILGSQFALAPVLKNPDQVTFQEEDRIVGFYGGGTLYASPERGEPLI